MGGGGYWNLKTPEVRGGLEGGGGRGVRADRTVWWGLLLTIVWSLELGQGGGRLSTHLYSTSGQGRAGEGACAQCIRKIEEGGEELVLGGWGGKVSKGDGGVGEDNEKQVLNHKTTGHSESELLSLNHAPEGWGSTQYNC